jgi:hypothetical protein
LLATLLVTMVLLPGAPEGPASQADQITSACEIASVAGDLLPAPLHPDWMPYY